MVDKRSLNATFLLCQVLLSVLSITVVGALWIYSQYSDFQLEALAAKESYLASQRSLIKSEVEKATDYIRYQKAQTLDRLKTSIRNRVYEAHVISQNIYEQNRGTKTSYEIQKMIKDALRPIRFNNGRGYYFATNMNGIEELFADRPEMEGKDMLPVRGGRGEFVVRDMIAIVKESVEGFYEYSWSKPGKEGNQHRKIAFVKLFEPYNWLIGTGEYFEDVEEDIQRETIAFLEQIAFGEEGYIFASKWDGRALIGPAKGKNVLDLTDTNGVQIVREFIKLSQRGGGFLEYVMPPIGSVRSAPKISYVSGIEDWQWYVGAGVFVDAIEKVAAEKKAQLDQRIRGSVIKIAGVLFGAILCACVVALYTSRKTGAVFGSFISFFRRSARELETIDPAGIRFSEFETLADSANQMVMERRLIEDAHKLNEQRLEAVLQLSLMEGATVEEIAGHTMEEAIRLTRSTVGYIAFMNEDETILTMHAWSKSTMQKCRIAERQIDYPVEATGLWGEAVRQRRPVITNDYAAPNPWKRGTPEGHVEIRRHMNIPILQDDRIVIVAGVGNKPTDYDDGDIRQINLLMREMWSIVERRRAEMSIAQSEELFRTVSELSHNAICIVDETGKILWANRRTLEISGYTQEQIRSAESFLELLAPDCIPFVTSNFMDFVVGKEYMHHYHFHIIRADGERRLIEKFMTGFINRQGRKNLIISMLDVTERQQAEEALRASEEKFSLAFRTSPYAIIITRANDGRFIEANDAFFSISGFTREEVLGRSSTELGLWVDDAERKRVVEDLLNSRKVLREEHRFRKKNGEILIGMFSAEVIPMNGERCILSSINDITDLKRAETEREKLQAQLSQAQKMESIGRLAGGVAHDFNNMLSVILGHTEMVMEQVDTRQPLFADLLEIEKAARRSADLTRQLLAFARRQTIAPTLLNLNDTVGGMLKLLGRLIGEDIDLAWLPGEDLWAVKMDPSQVDQMLANLCVNARDAIVGVGKVTIELGNIAFDETHCTDHPGFVPGEYVMLAVSDNGCGMDKETQHRIFEPFFTTKVLGKGTGLGLATVYGIVKQNEGFINVYSEPGRGTTFRIYLPRHLRTDENVSKEILAVLDTLGQETILLVEDEESILTMTTRMLERMGYVVLAASSPKEALRLADIYDGEIHLLMTDVVMPEMNGRELTKNLLSFYPNLRILFMSGYTANVIAHHGVLDEDVSFIQKPFSSKDLAIRLRAALGPRK